MAERAKTDDDTAGHPQACGARAETAPMPVVRQPPTGWARVRRAADSFGDLFYIQFAAIRTGWQWFFLMSSVIPLGLLLFLKFVAATANTTTVLYYITGNVVISLMFNSLGMLSGQLSWARQNKTFDFYAGLPVSRTVLILAAVAVSVLFSLPGMTVLTLLGLWIFHLALTPSPLVVVVLLLAPLALSGLGAVIGVLAPNQQVASVLSNLALVVVMFLSPVLVRASALPGILQITARAAPHLCGRRPTPDAGRPGHHGGWRRPVDHACLHRRQPLRGHDQARLALPVSGQKKIHSDAGTMPRTPADECRQRSATSPYRGSAAAVQAVLGEDGERGLV